MMKTTLILRTGLLGICLCFLLSVAALGQAIDAPRQSQEAYVKQKIGLTWVSVHYHSPSVTDGRGNDRSGKVWGQLVPYGQLWRAGANENTVVAFSDDVKVEGKALAAGKYGLHMEPGEKEWTVVFSKNTSSWGSFFYKEEEDALRVTVTPRQIQDKREWLSYDFTNRKGGTAELALSWEYLQVPIQIEVDVHALAIQNFKDELRGVSAFSWQGWNQAATYCLQNDVELEQGLAWAERSIAGGFGAEANYNTLSTKALILAKLNRQEEADNTMAKAVEVGNVFQIHQYGRLLIGRGQTDKALEVFKKNADMHPKTWPINVGLARGYSAVGNYKKALNHAKIALGNAPDELNKNSLTNMIQLLEEGKDVN